MPRTWILVALLLQGALALAAEPIDARALVERYRRDVEEIESFYSLSMSGVRLGRLDRFDRAWQVRLAALDPSGLDAEDRVDLTLLADHVEFQIVDREADRRRGEEVATLLPFSQTIVDLEEARWRMEIADGERSASLLAAIPGQVEELDRRLEKGLKRGKEDESAEDDDSVLESTSVLARRAARMTDELRRALEGWFRYNNGYRPDFAWWVRKPYEAARKALQDHARLLREKIAGGDEDDAPLVGDPIGRDALIEALRHERIPYKPEELLAIAEREAAWCEAEMTRAAGEMGETDWHAALERVKAVHAPPGEQAELVARQAREAIAFVEEHDLVTVEPLCAETWRLEMISKDGQRTLPFAAYSGQKMLVAYPTEDMDHDAKLMSMRGNNIHFSRIVTPHELIPGHHLQGYMAERHRPYRGLFRTPFLVEGWSLYWEMRLWELGYPQTPEDRIGMLFWRKHRTARIIVSLRFHLGEMTPGEMIDTLVDTVGMERDGATSEVRRYIGGGYGPLYQCAYMIGGLALRALHREVVESGTLTEREFHDAVLRQGPIPIEMIRAALRGEVPAMGMPPTWRFAD